MGQKPYKTFQIRREKPEEVEIAATAVRLHRGMVMGVSEQRQRRHLGGGEGCDPESYERFRGRLK
jgi:hypothetical protein